MLQKNLESKEQHSHKASKLRIVDNILLLALFAFTFALFLRIVITGDDPNNRLLPDLAVSALFLVPFMIEGIFKIKISDFILTFYIVFIVISAFFGNVFMWFDVVLGYDKLIHTTFGYVGCVIGLFFVCKLADVKTLTAFFIIIVCFSVSMMFEAIWEAVEFLGDSFLGQTAQGKPTILPDGNAITSVKDTMYDILCNVIGATIFIIHYIIHTKTKRNLLIGTMKADFSTPFIRCFASAQTK